MSFVTKKIFFSDMEAFVKAMQEAMKKKEDGDKPDDPMDTQ
jgi:hypothetical protein